jgi:hypothetical protein
MLQLVKGCKYLFGWTILDNEKYFQLSNEWLDLLALKPGIRLLVGRGSGLEAVFIDRGYIYNEDLKYTDLLLY